VVRHRRPELLGLPVERCSQLLGVCRSEYYARPVDEEAPDELEASVQELAAERPAYGYRRVAPPCARRGTAGPRTSASDRARESWAWTTTPGKGPASPNLAAGLRLTAPRQLLATDLSYVALPQGFAYVGVVLDAFSRLALGWAVSESLGNELPMEALEMALAREEMPPGWVHHSDRGCQYTSADYRERVSQAKGRLSDSKPGCPYDNAAMESVFKTYRYEEANFHTFRFVEELEPNLAAFLVDYNSRRLHSGLGYRSPIEFEALHYSTCKEIWVR
jgi:putative transposase